MNEEGKRKLGVKKETDRSQFKAKVLAYFIRAHEQSEGINNILIFEQGMQQAIKQAMTGDFGSDALLLSKTAKIVH